MNAPEVLHQAGLAAVGNGVRRDRRVDGDVGQGRGIELELELQVWGPRGAAAGGQHTNGAQSCEQRHGHVRLMTLMSWPTSVEEHAPVHPALLLGWT